MHQQQIAQIKKRQKLYAGAVIGLLVAVLIANVTRYYDATHNPLDSKSTEEISILIRQGDSVSTIADTLEEKEVIKNSWAFYWYLRLHGLDQDIISGRFLLSPSMTAPEIVAIISNPAESEAVITIQEGLKIHDIDTRLTEMELIAPGEFEQAVRNFDDYESYTFLDPTVLGPNAQPSLDLPLEGYLFPDTYFLDPIEFDPNNLIYKALNNFENKIEPYLQQIHHSPFSLHETLTLASILEKEVITPEDRALVSGILLKRMESGWRLDTDATLLYKKNDNKITTADLESNSPYNTRKHTGLTPGPIGNPSIESIHAILNPTTSKYWFYLTNPEGETIYATSNEEHNSNKAKHL
jgi:UPF0755 protein